MKCDNPLPQPGSLLLELFGRQPRCGIADMGRRTKTLCNFGHSSTSGERTLVPPAALFCPSSVVIGDRLTGAQSLFGILRRRLCLGISGKSVSTLL